MIDLTINDAQLERTVGRARERNIVVPTFEQMKDPGKIPMKVREKLKTVGLWDVDPANLFRVTWKNEPVPSGGLFGGVNLLELPGEITGVDARVVALVGKWFPTGSHKVGPTLGCLVPRLVTGQFDPTAQKAVWPSTGNYCRGGAYNSQLLACDSIAILPEGMSRERFEWLKTVAGEVIATPGSESNVKEIFDKTWELRRTRDDVVVFNQFEEFGNYLWHHEVTGSALEEAFSIVAKPGDRFFGVTFTSGSAGTLAAGDHMKKIFPASKIAVGEAIRLKEQEVAQLDGYRDRLLIEMGEHVMPELRDFITGNTKEEIDASFQEMINRTAAIVGGFQSVMGAQPVPGVPQIASAVPQQVPLSEMRGVSSSGAFPVGPLEQGPATQTLDPGTIRNMSMEEFRANRDRLHAAATQQFYQGGQ